MERQPKKKNIKPKTAAIEQEDSSGMNSNIIDSNTPVLRMVLNFIIKNLSLAPLLTCLGFVLSTWNEMQDISIKANQLDLVIKKETKLRKILLEDYYINKRDSSNKYFHSKLQYDLVEDSLYYP